TLPLVYIDDVVACILEAMNEPSKIMMDKSMHPICRIHPVHVTSLGELAEMITGFAEARKTLAVPYLAEYSLEKKLYSTYLSYLPEDNFSYPLTMHCDNRGSFTEILRSPERGQCSVNTIHPGITKGNHWHNSKNEKYLVVAGQCTTRLRKVGTDKVIEYVTDSTKLEVIDIPTGYTHSIQNTGETDAVVFMWVNEPFDPEHPDTIFLEVISKSET
ncbi:MAG: capsular polysaccharide biosynthesis protein CapF, partial [Faecalibacterium sp.]